MAKPTILFISALQEEIDVLWDDARFNWSDPREEGDSIWYRECECGEYRFVAAAACEMGLVASAIFATKMILQWRPVLIIALGICAGRKGFSLGDVVISSAAFLYRFGRHIEGHFVPDQRYRNLNEKLHGIVKDFEMRWPAAAGKIFEDRSPSPQAKLGAYAAADFVLKDENVMQEAARQHPDFGAVDMESYAIMRAAEVLDVPYGAVIVKAISDHGDLAKTDEGRAFVKAVSKEVAIALAQHFIGAMEVPPSVPGPALSSTAGGEQILVLCPQRGVFELMCQKLGSPRAVIVMNGKGSPLAYSCDTEKVILAAFPKGHFGHVDAAIWSSVLIDSIKPKLMMLVGSCGGVSKETRLGDLILANRAFHFQFGSFRAGALQPEVRSIDIHDGLRGFLFACSRTGLIDMLGNVYENYDPPEGETRPAHRPALRIDPLCSSDLYLRDEHKVMEAHGQDRKVIAVEMEGYAVMRAARHSSVPLGTLIVRSVADYADKESLRHMDFAQRLCSEAAICLLNNGLYDFVARHS